MDREQGVKHVRETLIRCRGSKATLDDELIEDTVSYLEELGWYNGALTPGVDNVLMVYCQFEWTKKHWMA